MRGKLSKVTIFISSEGAERFLGRLSDRYINKVRSDMDVLFKKSVNTSSCLSDWKGPDQSVYPYIAKEQPAVPLPEQSKPVKCHECHVAFQLPEIDYELRARNRDRKERYLPLDERIISVVARMTKRYHRKQDQLLDECKRSEVPAPHTVSLSDPLSPPTTEACTDATIEPTIQIQAVDSHIPQTLNHYELPWTLSFGHPSTQSHATGSDVSAAETNASLQESRVPIEESKPSLKQNCFPLWAVRVEFPPIPCPSHIALYKSMEEAAIAIINFHLSWYAIYDPKERYIYARSPDSGELDEVLLENLGLEIIWLPGYLIDLVEEKYPWLIREKFELHHQVGCTNDGSSFCLCDLLMKTSMKKSYRDVLLSKKKSTGDTSPTDDTVDLNDEMSCYLSGAFMELFMETTTSDKEKSMACMVDLQDEPPYCLSETFMELSMEENTSNEAHYMTEVVNANDEIVSQLLSANEHGMIDKSCEIYSLDESDENYSLDAKLFSYLSDNFLEHLIERRIVVAEEPRVLETCAQGKPARTPLKGDISPPEWATFTGQTMPQSQRRKEISPKWPSAEQGVETLATTTHPRAVNMSFDASALRISRAEASPASSIDVGLSDTSMSDLEDHSMYIPSRASFKYGQYRPRRSKKIAPQEPVNSMAVDRPSFKDILRGIRTSDEEFASKLTEDNMELEEGQNDIHERRCNAGCSNQGQSPLMPIGDVPSLTPQQPAIPSSPTVHVKWKKVNRKKLTHIELSMGESKTTAASEKDVEIILASESLPYFQLKITDIPVRGQGPENKHLKAVDPTECHVKLPSGFSFSEHASIMVKMENSSKASSILPGIGTDTGVKTGGGNTERVLQPVCVVQALQARGSLSNLHRMSSQISLNLSPKSPSIPYVGFDGAIRQLEPDNEDEP